MTRLRCILPFLVRHSQVFHSGKKGVVNAMWNQEERNFFESFSRWTPELTLSCSANEKVCISIGICSLSAVLCVIACLLLLCKRYRRKSWYVGDSAGSVLYCFLGNLCGTVGAFLSYQLVIQVFMGVLLTTLDVLHLIFIIIPVFGKTERRMKIMRQRRRQNVMVMSLPLALGVGVFAYHGVYPVQRNKGPVGRHLLSLDLQDNLEILGYTLGLLSFVIGWTSKLPFFSKAYQGKTLAEGVSFGMLSALANVLYGSAILLFDLSLASALRALPWLLNCFGCAAFDVVAVNTQMDADGPNLWTSMYMSCWHNLSNGEDKLKILGLSCIRKCQEQGTLELWDTTDTQSLLGSPPTDPPSPMHPGSEKTSLKTLRSKKCLKNTAEIGQYLDVNIHPVQPVPKVFLQEVKISNEGQTGSLPQRTTLKEEREVDPCSSDSSSTSSSINPDLEWDFEEANANWNKVQRPLKRTSVFPLREWRVQFGLKHIGKIKSSFDMRPGNMEKRSVSGGQHVAAPSTDK